MFFALILIPQIYTNKTGQLELILTLYYILLYNGGVQKLRKCNFFLQ